MSKKETVYITLYTALGGLDALKNNITDGVNAKLKPEGNYVNEIQVPVYLVDRIDDDEKGLVHLK